MELTYVLPKCRQPIRVKEMTTLAPKGQTFKLRVDEEARYALRRLVKYIERETVVIRDYAYVFIEDEYDYLYKISTEVEMSMSDLSDEEFAVMFLACYLTFRKGDKTKQAAMQLSQLLYNELNVLS